MTSEYADNKKVFISMGCIAVIFIVNIYAFPSRGFSFTQPNTYLADVTMIAFIAAGLRLLILVSKKQFRFYLAKGYFTTTTKMTDEFQQTKYFD